MLLPVSPFAPRISTWYLPGARTSSMGVLPMIFPFTQMSASTGAARSRTLPASFPAPDRNSRTLVSCGGRPEEAIKCWEAAPFALAGNFGICTGFTEFVAAAETEVVPAVSATAWAWAAAAKKTDNNVIAIAALSTDGLTATRTREEVMEEIPLKDTNRARLAT